MNETKKQATSEAAGEATSEAASSETETQRGPRRLESEARGPRSTYEAERLRQIVAECDREEANLYAQRGHGGYIDSAHIEAIRLARKEAAARLARDKKSAHA